VQVSVVNEHDNYPTPPPAVNRESGHVQPHMSSPWNAIPTTQSTSSPVSPTPITPISNHSYPSEKSGLFPHPTSGQFYNRDPQTWTLDEVSQWLQYKNVAGYIIELFRREGITGRSLVSLTKEDMTGMGVRLFGERLELVTILRELKLEWRIPDGAEGDVVGGVYTAAVASSPRVMEVGKGAFSTDSPPLYSAN
jgi:hypothetical protein